MEATFRLRRQTSLNSHHHWQHHDPNKIPTSRKVTRDPQLKKETQKSPVATCQAVSSLMLNVFYCTKMVLLDVKTDGSLKGILSPKNAQNEDACRQTTGGWTPVARCCLASLFNRLLFECNKKELVGWGLHVQDGVMLTGLLLFRRGITRWWECLGRTSFLPPG